MIKHKPRAKRVTAAASPPGEADVVRCFDARRACRITMGVQNLHIRRPELRE